MLNILRNWFGNKKQPASQDASFQRLNEVAPLHTDHAEAGDNRSFVCREPILNRNERIAGYEFLLHQRFHSRLAGKSPTVIRAYDDALMRSLSSAGVNGLLGHRMAFIGISPVSFDNTLLVELGKSHTVLLIDPASEALQAVDQLNGRLLEAKSLGCRIACRLSKEMAADDPLLALCDFVQISIPDYDGLEIADWARRLRRQKGPQNAAPPALIAAHVQNSDEFQVCYRAGFDYFHGPFVSRRENWHPPRSNIDRTRVMQLLAQLRSGVDSAELAASIRQDAVLSYKLLRYLNSAGHGLSQELTSIDQGFLLLGRDRFYRWLSLLLFDVQKAAYTERVLIEQALVRANLMERLGQRVAALGISPDQFFLTGLFSLLDQLLARSLEDILVGVSVPEHVAQALLADGGPLAPFLALAVACESGAQEEIAERAAICQVDAGAVNQDLLAALVWANEMADLSH